MTKKEKKEYDRKRYQANKKRLGKQHQEYYQANKERLRKQHREYYQTHKEQEKEYSKKKYQIHREEVKERSKRWTKKHPKRAKEIWRKRANKRDRNLGLNPLNDWFAGSEAHHINFNDVIYIPKELHKSISHNIWTGRNMALINSIAYQFLFSNYIIYN